MRLQAWSVGGALWAAVMCLHGTALAAPEPSAESRDIRTWLMRIHDAAGQRNYQGTFIVSGGGAVSSARIAHYCEGKDRYERIDTLDGERRLQLRHNDKVHVLWPQQKVAELRRRDLPVFPSLLQTGGDRLAEFYEVQAQGVDRVAGHEADVLMVKAKDAHRYGYKLWAERQTGLLLRADVIGERGDVLETSAFSEVTIGVKPQIDAVLASIRKSEGYRVVRHTLQPTQLESEGWVLRAVAPGFMPVSCVKRPLDASERDAPAPEVIQTIYSDGLTHVSLFIEPYRSDRHVKPLAASLGATQTLMQRHGDWWITVVGDVPMATLRLFTKSLERKN